MSWMEQIAEERLRTVESGGKFSHLPGKGRPVGLEDNSRFVVYQSGREG
jgi:hypothetical protein